MKLSAPTTSTFIVGVLLLIVGLLMRIDVLSIADLDQYRFWITFAGGAVLAAGSLFKGI
ncbi:MAG: hypothetical protein AAGD35_07765 [Actinomycetota bacterium]